LSGYTFTNKARIGPHSSCIFCIRTVISEEMSQRSSGPYHIPRCAHLGLCIACAVNKDRVSLTNPRDANVLQTNKVDAQCDEPAIEQVNSASRRNCQFTATATAFNLGIPTCIWRLRWGGADRIRVLPRFSASEN